MKYLLLLTLLFSSPVWAMTDHHDHEAMMKAETMTEPQAMPAIDQTDHANHQMNDEAPTMAMEKPEEVDPAPAMDHGTMHGMKAHHSAVPSTEAYTHIHHTMHSEMAIDFTGDADIDFLRGMIPHHQGAVDMANVQRTYGQDGNVKNFANKVIRDQVKEIRWMGLLLETLEADRADKIVPTNGSTLANKLVNKNMHREMAVKYTGNADVDFMVGMIPHHQGAIDMAKVVLKYGTDKRVKSLARGIINAQEAETTGMKKWLSRLKWRTNLWR